MSKKLKSDDVKSTENRTKKEDALKIVSINNYGQLGKMEKIDLSSLKSEVEYLVYAQWR